MISQLIIPLEHRKYKTKFHVSMKDRVSTQQSDFSEYRTKKH